MSLSTTFDDNLLNFLASIEIPSDQIEYFSSLFFATLDLDKLLYENRFHLVDLLDKFTHVITTPMIDIDNCAFVHFSDLVHFQPVEKPKFKTELINHISATLSTTDRQDRSKLSSNCVFTQYIIQRVENPLKSTKCS